jgi:hypothetical protein
VKTRNHVCRRDHRAVGSGFGCVLIGAVPASAARQGKIERTLIGIFAIKVNEQPLLGKSWLP